MSVDPSADRTRAVLDRVFREEAGRLTASLVRRLDDFDLAEELVSEAVVEALEHWPSQGIPDQPQAWLLTTARRKGIHRLRRANRLRAKLAALTAELAPTSPEEDDRLRLIFTCCHPALAREAQVALTLRAVAGLTTDEIARAFLVSAPTLGKRIVRAKQKIVDSRIPYRVPGGDQLKERLDEVLTVIYLIFNEGYVSTMGDSPLRRDLAEDAEWLATLLVRLLPEEPEALGLLSLIRLHLARWPARIREQGSLVLLEAQDRRLWNHAAIADAIKLIERAARHRRPGRFLVEASIAAVHGESPSWEATDFAQILALYDILVELDPSPVTRLNRAIAVWQVAGAAVALAAVDQLTDDLAGYYPFHATRAALLMELGREAEAREGEHLARAGTANPWVRDLISERLRALALSVPRAEQEFRSSNAAILSALTTHPG